MDVVFRIEKVKFNNWLAVNYEKGAVQSINPVTGWANIKVSTGAYRNRNKLVRVKDIVEITKPTRPIRVTVDQHRQISKKYHALLEKYPERFLKNLRDLGYNNYEIVTLSGKNLKIMWDMYMYMSESVDREYADDTDLINIEIDKAVSEENSYPLGVLESDISGMPLDDLDEAAGTSEFENSYFGL